MFCKINTKRSRGAEIAFEEANRSIGPIKKFYRMRRRYFSQMGKEIPRDRSIARYSSDYEGILGPGIFKWEKREIGTKDRK